MNLDISRSLEDIWGPQRNPLIVVIPVTALYGLILIFGFFGNIITCVVVVRNRYMRTVTNYYLLSLAISDLLLLMIGLPSEIYQMWYKWVQNKLFVWSNFLRLCSFASKWGHIGQLYRVEMRSDQSFHSYNTWGKRLTWKLQNIRSNYFFMLVYLLWSGSL